MSPFRTLDNVDVAGKRVLVRIDINSPLNREDMKIRDDSKIASVTPTIKELSEKSAKIVLIAHQGRKDRWDFVDLSEHSQILQRMLEREVRYVDDLIGADAKREISSIANGEIIVLKNLRSISDETAKLSPEEHARGLLVSTLAPQFELFVNDAFATAHRTHASTVGFPIVLPSVAGRLMETEIRNLNRIVKNPERPSVFVFGGVKFADAIPILADLLEGRTADKLILGGLLGLAFAAANGKRIGSKNIEILRDELTSENTKIAEELYSRFEDNIVLPVDMSLDGEPGRIEWDIDGEPPDYQALDIGTKSISIFGDILSNAKTILISGPVGVFEREAFSAGTRAIFEKSTSGNAFCVIGGGHTTAAANQMGFSNKVSYISTGGGALEHFILGKPLPAIAALEFSAEKSQ